jgi:hypothetical protein
LSLQPGDPAPAENLKAAAALVLAYQTEAPDEDIGLILSLCDPAIVAQILGRTLAAMIDAAGGEADQLVPALIAERMRRVTLHV